MFVSVLYFKFLINKRKTFNGIWFFMEIYLFSRKTNLIFNCKSRLKNRTDKLMLTFISFVASFKTLFTIPSSSFLLGFFSIFRYKLIWNQEETAWPGDLFNPALTPTLILIMNQLTHQSVTPRTDITCNSTRSAAAALYLLSEQHRRVAVFAVGLWAQCGQPQQKEDEGGAPHHQLPVCLRLQESFVASQELNKSRSSSRVDICSPQHFVRGLQSVIKCVHRHRLTWAQMMNEIESAKRKMVETMTSTERCGPRLCKEQETKWCTIGNEDQSVPSSGKTMKS